MIGIAEGGAHHEAVQLRLGEPIGSRLLDGVLRGEDEERLAHRARDAVDRDAALLHDLEQRRLGLRARTVDLVREDDVGEDGPGVELEHALLLVVDADAGDVAGEEVGGELDAGVGALHRLPHGPRERGLPRPGDVLEQHVAVAQHRGEHELHDVALPQHRPLDVVGELREGLREPGRLLLRDRHVSSSCVVSVVGAVGRADAAQGFGAGSGSAGGGGGGASVGVQSAVTVPVAF